MPDSTSPLNFQASYDWVSPGQIVFGWGRRFELGELIRAQVKRVFVVSGSRTLNSNGIVQELLLSLNDIGIETKSLATISNEPLVTDVDQAVNKICNFDLTSHDAVLGIGGGAAIDLAKAVSALAMNREGHSVCDYLEGVGKGLQISETPLPLIAMPTTAGAGSEATKNAVISSYEPTFKKSLRSNKMLARWVIVDPELTVSLPASQTAACGMDAITQLLESYLSNRAKPISDALCLHGLPLAFDSIQTCFEEGFNQAAREKMAHAALLSGMALANSGLGMAHGVAASLGVNCNVNHGLACAVMLPITLKTNKSACLQRMANAGRLLAEDNSLNDNTAADWLINRVETLNKQLMIPSQLSHLGVVHNQIPDIVTNSRGNSMNGNPRELSDAELTHILESIL